MRWLFVKDLQILRRSPLLVGLLVVYPVAVALMTPRRSHIACACGSDKAPSRANADSST